ncbi:MAG TPA: outer membrane beta-barrel protein [Chthoniobacterales bacterium]|nr:outer membrane beta-barrel protein [Chthoniobacterales bacterium]
MKKITALAVVGLTSQAITGFAGEPVVPSKEVVPPPAPVQELYRANEWQFDVFGAYAPAGGRGNRFLGDHAWGGGGDVNYFFTKYFGLGLEGDILSGTGRINSGAVSGQFALNGLVRYPIGHTGFAPYAFAGIGGFVPGEGSDFFTFSHGIARRIRNGNSDDVLLEGHWGAGLEYRFTHHIGVFADGRYEVVDKSRNNFGLIRTGVRFAF